MQFLPVEVLWSRPSEGCVSCVWVHVHQNIIGIIIRGAEIEVTITTNIILANNNNNNNIYDDVAGQLLLFSFSLFFLLFFYYYYIFIITSVTSMWDVCRAFGPSWGHQRVNDVFIYCIYYQRLSIAQGYACSKIVGVLHSVRRPLVQWFLFVTRRVFNGPNSAVWTPSIANRRIFQHLRDRQDWHTEYSIISLMILQDFTRFSRRCASFLDFFVRINRFRGEFCGLFVELQELWNQSLPWVTAVYEKIRAKVEENLRYDDERY